jgi:hypothetical protein
MTTEYSHGDAGRIDGPRSRRNDQRRVPALARALAGIAVGLLALGAQAATDSSDAKEHAYVPPSPVSVLPAHIELSAKAPTVVVTVHNDHQRTAMVVLLQPMIWTQDGIAPHYALTSDVVAVPATFTVPPGTTQAVEVELQATTQDLSGQDFQLFWQARAEPVSTYTSDERAAP